MSNRLPFFWSYFFIKSSIKYNYRSLNWEIKIIRNICFNVQNVHFPSFFWKKKSSFDKKLADLSLKHSSCERVTSECSKKESLILWCGLGSFVVEATLVRKWKMKREREINVLMMHVLRTYIWLSYCICSMLHQCS